MAQNLQDEALKNWIRTLDTIEKRLQESQLDVQTDVAIIMNKLLPSSAATDRATATALRSICEIALHSHLEPDTKITSSCHVILGDINEENNEEINNRTRFYARSIRFARTELVDILHRYQQDYADALFCLAWLDEIEQHQEITNFYVRYIGCTTRSPFDRVKEDNMAAQRNLQGGGSRYMNFYRSMIAVMGPESAHRAIEVYQFPTLEVRRNVVTEDGFVAGGGLTRRDVAYATLVDNTEQILIHFFGRQFLLNKQPGGYHASYAPPANYVAIVQSIDNITNRIIINRRQQTTEMQQLVRERYQAFAAEVNAMNENPARVTDEHVNLFVEQAVTETSHVNGVTPLVLFGKDITKEDFSTLRRFIDGSRTGTLVQNLMRSVSFAPQEDDLFSLVNFYPTLYHGNLDLHISTSAQILESLQSVVMCTLGFLPTAVATSHFHGRHRLMRQDYANAVGIPTIVNLDANYDYQNIEEDPRDVHCILVPNYDPGRFKYGDATPVFYNVLYLVFAISEAIKQCARQVLFSVNSPIVGTRTFCERVLEIFNNSVPHALMELLRVAKEELNERTHNEGVERFAAMSRRHNSLFYETETFSAACRETMNNRIQQIGHFRGDQNTPERHREAIVTLRQDYPSLRPFDIYNLQHENEWEAWFQTQQEGASILQTVNHAVQVQRQAPVEGMTPERVNYMNTLFGGPPPGWEGGNEWMLIPELVELARKKKSEAFRKSEKFAQANRIKLANMAKAIPIADVFLDWPVKMSSSKTRVAVRINGRTLREPNGIYWMGNPTNGDYYLHYDSEVAMRSLFLKDKATNLPVRRTGGNNEIIMINDVQLYASHRETYYLTFVKTCKLFGVLPRQELQDAYEEDIAFDPARVLRRVWERLCQDGPTDVYTTRGRVPNVITTLQEVINQADNDQVVQNAEFRLDRVVWENEMAKEPESFNKYLLAQMETLVGRFQHEMDQHRPVRGEAQVRGRLWHLPQYQD